MTRRSTYEFLIGPISPAAPGPLYRQIVEGVRREVARGRLKPGDEMPSFRVLAELLLVSLITVKRAYEELEREGILYRRQGLGTFVAERGDDRSRESNLAAADQHFQTGLQLARQAGLSEPDIADWVLRILKQKKVKS